MSSLRLASLTARATLSLSRGCESITTTTQTLATKRTFSSLPHLRPSIIAPNGTGTVFRSCDSGNTLLPRLPPTTTTSPAGATNVLDIVPKSAITAHPALAGPQQIRCGPRPTMARSSRLVRKRRHGFLSRLRTRNGRKTLQYRKDKKRHVLSM
ncbi:hypothetical protein CIB48_g1606 [Xylaria polymorpha]|nr:hypothetical protein CIB48_g1606 [Xylaria polymorpha]